MSNVTNKMTVVNNQRGSVINVALLILLLLAVIGFAVSQTSTTDVKIAGNFKAAQLAFYAAEAGRAYVESDSALYGSGNVTPGTGENFPVAGNDSVTQALGDNQSFKGVVTYQYVGNAPRGMGYGVGEVFAHNYMIESTGYYEPRDTESKVACGVFRFGLSQVSF